MRLSSYRSLFAASIVVAACADSPPEVELARTAQELDAYEVTREHIAGDVYHYGFRVRVGDGPNAQLHLHRVVRELAPWEPRNTSDALMLLHGDFSTFATNFAPAASTSTGMATWLAERDIDVWGFDRRWTQAPAIGADLSDFDAMGLDQQLDDIATALAFARGIRLDTDPGDARMTLAGFSRGGQLAYFYAAREARGPQEPRHVKGLVPLDVYASLSPADDDLRDLACDFAEYEYDSLADGYVDVPNEFQSTVGQLALAAPDDPSPYQIFPGVTNRGMFLAFVGRTHRFFPATPLYHLNAPVFTAGRVSALRLSSEEVVATWLAGATPHQSLRESADTDALVCDQAPLPASVALVHIRVPLLLIGAAGGYGDHALYSTTQVSSTDVTTHVIRQLPVEREAEDFGHADLLFAPDAPALAWQPLLAWLVQH
jgi:hypothetical protein